MSCFHPFQGRPPFGLQLCRHDFSEESQSFHPFQGRPPFGLAPEIDVPAELRGKFPSLSGKTSIRTEPFGLHQVLYAAVSIPFREDLHSDELPASKLTKKDQKVSIPFREDLHSDLKILKASRLGVIMVSIPFREDLHSDRHS